MSEWDGQLGPKQQPGGLSRPEADRRCACGTPIVWALLDAGGRIPLDLHSAVYETFRRPDGRLGCRKAEGYVVHYRTCPGEPYPRGRRA